MQDLAWRVDHGAHRLHIGGRIYPCDRDIVASAAWNDQVLLLSADTDCLSLWDAEGLIRTTRVGVYPQDMAVQEGFAWVCGGTDGKVHWISLPDLHIAAQWPVPGMPERLVLHGDSAYVLCLVTEPDIHTMLLKLNLYAGEYAETASFAGIPGTITADDAGLWIGVSEQVMHLPWGSGMPDVRIEGIGLARLIVPAGEGIIIEDSLEERTFYIRT